MTDKTTASRWASRKLAVCLVALAAVGAVAWRMPPDQLAAHCAEILAAVAVIACAYLVAQGRVDLAALRRLGAVHPALAAVSAVAEAIQRDGEGRSSDPDSDTKDDEEEQHERDRLGAIRRLEVAGDDDTTTRLPRGL